MFTSPPFQTPPITQPDARETGLRRFVSVAACLAVVLFLAWLITSHLPALIISIPIVAMNLEGVFYTLYIITPVVVPIIDISGFPFYLYFSGIVMIIVLSLSWVFKNEFKEFARIVIAVLGEGKRFPIESKNSYILVSQLFIATISFSIAYLYLLQSFGTQIVSPDFKTFTLWEFLFGMMNASVYEEIISRVILIGIPLLVVHLAVRQNKYKIRKYLLGGGFEIDRLSIFLIILSSTIFGAAHVLYGWDWYKFPEAFIIGIAFGYLFLKKGLHTSILLHFAVDYSSALPMILLRYMGNVPANFSSLYALALGLNAASVLALFALILLCIILGPVYFWHYGKNAVKCLVSVLQKQPDIRNEPDI
ncbi:MAG: CPBP family intramembrane glutamic endopeptidase [Thermoplasmata archaeon]